MGFMNQLAKVKTPRPACIKCGLHKNCENPKIPAVGEGKKKILIINDYVHEKDDVFNTHISDLPETIFPTFLQDNGIEFHNDCWRTSLVNCCPQNANGYTRSPTKKEYRNCFPMLKANIKKLKPQKIILLGSTVIEEFYKDRKLEKPVTLTNSRGTKFYDSNFDAWVYPIYHPLDARGNKFDRVTPVIFENDVREIISDKELLPEIPDVYKQVRMITSFEEVMSALRDIIKQKPLLAFDYETTGLQPYITGHKILTVGIATDDGDCFAFPMQHKHFRKDEQARITRLWGKILGDIRIKKIVHSLNFEYAWSSILAKVEPQGIIWDTQSTTHILDNRHGITSLKFQLFKRYGIGDYDKAAKKYIKSHGDNPFNRMEKMPIPEILTYNAIDALGTLWLYRDQKKELKGGRRRANTLFFQGQLALAKSHLNGMRIDIEYVKNQEKLYRERLVTLEQEFLAMPEVKNYHEKTGKTLRISSLDELKDLLYGKDYLNLTPTKYTDKGNISIDEEVLTRIGTPLTEKILAWRRTNKDHGTYLKGILRVTVDEFMHPYFHLHIPISYRSSSTEINFQNLPKRDPARGHLVRSAIIPTEDNDIICEIDFSGAEVCTSVCYHKDPTFLAYLTDPNSDMHRDNACDLFILEVKDLVNPKFTYDQKKRAKEIRFYAKNMWTFAQFYGDWHESCAENLWEYVVEAGLKLPDGVTVRDHLAFHNIHTIQDFIDHCKKVERKMWYERFPIYTQWKNDIVEFFLKHGYIETFLGFKFIGPMDKKQMNNYPIQGTSFHLLLYTLVKLQRELEKRGLKTKVIGQIHDSIIANVPAKELPIYRKIVKAIVGSLHKKFDWLIVPMEIEMEISKTKKHGGKFSEMTEVPV